MLAGVGIFSVLAYLVGLRSRELTLRQALGAQAADIARLVAGRGLRLLVIGLALGLLGALVGARLLTSLLFEIAPWDLGATIILGGVALVASYGADRLISQPAARVVETFVGQEV